jgi:hypothetical protein
MAQRAPHLDRLQPMSTLLRASPLLWWRPWSRLCSFAFVATILGFALTRAEPPSQAQETCRTPVSQSASQPCATAPAADSSPCDCSAPEALAWASTDEQAHLGAWAGDATEPSRLYQEAQRDCGPGEDDSIAHPIEP